MAEIILRDFYCYLCSLQFDGKLVYDMHQSLVHKYKNDIKSVQEFIKTEFDGEETQTTCVNPNETFTCQNKIKLNIRFVPPFSFSVSSI